MEETFVQTLTIAGSDSGGGAGIQADLKTFQMRGVFGTSVLTAVTAQNTLGVSAVHLIPTDIIAAQIEAIRADFEIRAYKIGMLGTAQVIECIAENLKKCRFGKRVLDPVMIAKGGAPLLQDSAVEAMKRLLLPDTDILTPNLPEAEALTGVRIENRQDAERAAKILQDCGVKNVVIKGGHLGDSRSEYCTDWLFTPDDVFEFADRRFPTAHTHGTGCTLSSAIAANLAKGFDLHESVGRAKEYVSGALAAMLDLGRGSGPMNHAFDLQGRFAEGM